MERGGEYPGHTDREGIKPDTRTAHTRDTVFLRRQILKKSPPACSHDSPFNHRHSDRKHLHHRRLLDLHPD